MNEIGEKSLKFEFPESWSVGYYDEWAFYKNQFQKVGSARVACAACGHRHTDGCKALDIVAGELGARQSCCWCIEVKDYRQHPRTKPSELPDEMALKVRDTLAGLVAARVHATKAEERSLAQAALGCDKLRVVLHLEQPAKPSSLVPHLIDPADVQQSLRQLVRAIDAHPVVVSIAVPGSVPWTVTTAPSAPPPQAAGPKPRHGPQSR